MYPSKGRWDGWLLAAGIVFMVGWIGLHGVWAALSGMASLMANDSGAASNGAHMTLILGMLAGQVVAGAAGIPGGLVFFWRGKRWWMLGSFVVLFGVGAVTQWAAFHAFFAAASR